MERKFCKDESIIYSDISVEKYRTYQFPTGIVRVDNPKFLSVSKSGGHRIVDKNDVCHYVPSGWLKMSFESDSEFYWEF